MIPLPRSTAAAAFSLTALLLATGMHLPASGQETAASLFAAAREAIDADDYAKAQSLLTQAGVAAQGDLAAQAEVADARRTVGALQKEYAKLARPLATLRKSPNDLDANEAVGRFYAFSKGDWDRGLPLLARSKDAQLKRAATFDLSRPSNLEDLMKLGDAWREVADSARDAEEVSRATLRAREWYLMAAESALNDADRQPIQERLDLLKLYPTKIVIVNSHNGPHNDRGALLIELKLLFEGNVVLNRRLTMPWKIGESVPVTVRVPRTRVDAVQVDVLKWPKAGGALAEIEAYQDDVNLARDGAAEASGIHNAQFGADKISDGDWGAEKQQTGSWVLPDREAGWVRVYLDRR